MWTWEEIESKYLRLDLPAGVDSNMVKTPTVGHPHDEVVGAFNTVEKCLSRDWVERRGAGSFAGGVVSTFALGRCLQALAGVTGADQLIDKLRKGTPGARSEIDALYLVRNERDVFEAEYEPEVVFDGKRRKADFAVRLDSSEPWIYLEAKHPNASREEREITTVQERLAGAIRTIEGSSTVEVVLKKMLSDVEVSVTDRFLRTLPRGGEPLDLPLPQGIGRVFVNCSDEYVNDMAPRVGPSLVMASTVLGDGSSSPHLTVRMEFSDDRAEEMLQKKARQLPGDAPGLIMLDIWSPVDPWASVAARCFSEGRYPHVGGVCLFNTFPLGEPCKWVRSGTYVQNERATHPIPDWLRDTLNSLPSLKDAMAN
jgi:hypothetical protein